MPPRNAQVINPPTLVPTLSLSSYSTKERANRLLRLRRQAGKQLIRIQPSIRDEFPRRANNPLRHGSLQRLGLQSLRDEDKASRRLQHNRLIGSRNPYSLAKPFTPL